MSDTLSETQIEALQAIIVKLTEVVELLAVLGTTSDPYYFGLGTYHVDDFIDDCHRLLKEGGI